MDAMTLNPAAQRYDRVARALHWIIAGLVLGNIAGGLLADALDGVVNVMPLHMAIGMTVLALTLVRIGWRFTWRAPAFPAGTSAIEAGAARATHFAFYALMLAMPVTGWMMASAGKTPLSWFGLVTLPKLPVTRADPAFGFAHETHEIAGLVFLALALLHIAAALRHHFILRDNVLARML